MMPLGRELSSHRLQSSDSEDAASNFECNICLDMAKDPVVTMCGHLYCWPCLYRWVSRNSSCPVCKDFVDENKLIPIYTRQQSSEMGSSGNSTAESPIPERPAGLRLLMPTTAPTETPRNVSQRSRRWRYDWESLVGSTGLSDVRRREHESDDWHPDFFSPQNGRNLGPHAGAPGLIFPSTIFTTHAQQAMLMRLLFILGCLVLLFLLLF